MKLLNKYIDYLRLSVNLTIILSFSFQFYFHDIQIAFETSKTLQKAPTEVKQENSIYRRLFLHKMENAPWKIKLLIQSQKYLS